MGLFNKRNLAKAKALAERNKEKIASGVNKATDTIDKKTGGKHTDKLKKIDDAAKKFAGDDTRAGTDTSASRTTTSGTTASGTTASGTTASGTTASGTTSPVADTDTTPD